MSDVLPEAPPGTEAPLPLAGYTVAVTAARRREELGALLARRGARVVYAPAIRIVPLADDAELVAATREALARPVDLVVATTGVGFRGWLEAADAWDLPLVEHLLSGAEGPLEGRRVAVQLHGDPLPDLVAGLRRTGAEVLTVPVYRWVLPEDVAPLHRLVSSIATAGVDAVTFTSAPAAASLLTVAEELGLRDAVVAALRGRVLAVAVGPVTAGPLADAGIASQQPERARLGALAREVVARLPERDPVLAVGGHTLQVRGYAAVVDDRVVELAPGPLSVLRALVARPGAVLSRSELVDVLGGGGDAHAVEMAVTRLRAALGAPLVETVVKRGYRLKV